MTQSVLARALVVAPEGYRIGVASGKSQRYFILTSWKPTSMKEGTEHG